MRLCCRRVVGVHIAVPEKASTTPRNHARPGHSTLSGRALSVDGNGLFEQQKCLHLRLEMCREHCFGGWRIRTHLAHRSEREAKLEGQLPGLNLVAALRSS